MAQRFSSAKRKVLSTVNSLGKLSFSNEGEIERFSEEGRPEGVVIGRRRLAEGHSSNRNKMIKGELGRIGEEEEGREEQTRGHT